MASGLKWLLTEIRSLRLAGTVMASPARFIRGCIKITPKRGSPDGTRRDAHHGTASSLVLRHLLIAFPNAD
jgi:hypothetical protein